MWLKYVYIINLDTTLYRLKWNRIEHMYEGQRYVCNQYLNTLTCHQYSCESKGSRPPMLTTQEIKP